MSNITATLVSGQTAVVGVASSREAYEIEVSTGVAGATGVGVVGANIVGGMLNITLSNSATINAGSVVGTPVTGSITFTGNTIGQASNGSINISTDAKTWTFGANGTFAIPGGISANGSVGTTGQVLTSNGTTAYWNTPAAANTQTDRLTSNGQNVVLGSDKRLTLPGTLVLPGGIALEEDDGSLYVSASDDVILSALGTGKAFIRTANETKEWEFGTDGNITLPVDGTVLASNGARVTNIYANNKLYVGSNFTQMPVSVLVSGAGPRNEWAFTPDSVLTLPQTGKISVVGIPAANVASLKTAYEEAEVLYQDALTSWRTSSAFTPVWFKMSGRLAYDQIIAWTLPNGVPPLPVNLVPLAYTCKISYSAWQDAVTSSKLSVKSDTASWEFDSTSKLTLPQGGSIVGGNTAAIQAAYDEWQQEQTDWLYVITTGGTDTNIRPWHFAGPSPEERMDVVLAMWQAQQTVQTLDWVPISAAYYNEVRAWLSVSANSDGYRLWKKLTTGVNITSDTKTWAFTNDGAITFPDSTVQTKAFVGSYDQLTLGLPRIPRSTATNAIHAVDISNTNNNRDGIVIYDTGDSRVRMYANGTGWYTFATTADVAAVADRLTSNGHTVVLGTDGVLTAPGEVYGQYFSLRGGNSNGTIGSLGYGGNTVDLFGTEGVNITTSAPEDGPQWRFGTDGVLTTSGNGTIATSNTGSNTSMKIAVHWNDPSASPAVNHVTSVWTFQHNGITFPDSTTQRTAFTGNATNASLLGGIAADQYTTYGGSYSWTNTHVFSNTIQMSTIRGVQHDVVGDNVTGVPIYSGAGANSYVWMGADLSNTNTQAVVAFGDITGWTITAEDNPSVTATVTSMNPVGNWSVGTSGPLAYSAGRTFKFTSPDYAAAYVQAVSVNVSSNTWTFNSNGALTFPDSTLQTTAFNVANAYTFSGVHTHSANVIFNAATTISGNAAAAFGNVTINGTLTATGNISGNTAGFEIGYKDIPQNYTNTSFTIALSDRGKHIYTANGTAQTITIANNASVAFPIGTAITIVSQGAGTITVARGTGVSLYLAANNTSADRTVSTYGMATLLKVATDTWFISGAGVA